MKWKQGLYSLIIGAGITMSMVACSDDPTEGKDGSVAAEEYGWYSFRNIMQSATGARATRATDPGTEPENMVNRMRIVFYNNDDGIAHYAFDYSGTSLHGTGQDFLGTSMLDPASPDAPAGYSPSKDGGFAPMAMKLKIASYKMLVLLNPSDAVVNVTRAKEEWVDITPESGSNGGVGSGMSNATVFKTEVGRADGNDLTDFIGASNYSDNPDNFLMSNYQDLVNIPEDFLQTTPKLAYLASVVVKVDRAVAKVSMKTNYADLENASNAWVSGGTWRLDITNKTSFWMRKMAPSLGGGVENSNTDRENFYAEDPNFDKYSWTRYESKNLPVPTDLVTTSADDYKTYFNTITEADVNINLTNDFTYEYALENTMAAEEQFQDVSTAAILRITYYPKMSSAGTTMAQSGGYFIWKTWVLTPGDLVEIRDMNVGSADPDYKTFYDLKQYLLGADRAELEAAFGQSYTNGGAVSRKVKDLTWNADGINYYRIMIRHFGDSQANDHEYGAYGIVRNNWYRLTLNKINGPGEIEIPEPVGPNPEKQYLGLSVQILPWLLRDQDVDVR
jgi:hypothetical protein